MNLDFKRKLPIPKEIKADFPVTEDLAKIKAERDKEVKDIFEGKSDKFILVIGPCSADSKESVLDYVGRLKDVADEVKDSVYVAGAKLEDGVLKNAGGRVLGVTAVEETLEKAIDSAYEKVQKVTFANAFYRKDIGKKAKEAK